MEISEVQLQKFIDLYKMKFNITLTPAEAQQKALSLLRFLSFSIITFQPDINEVK